MAKSMSDDQRKAMFANMVDISRSNKRSNKLKRPKRSGIRSSIHKPIVKLLSSSDFYDEYTKRRKTIVPAKGFFDHKSGVIYINRGAVTSKKDLEHTIRHELGHSRFGPSELLAEDFAKSASRDYDYPAIKKDVLRQLSFFDKDTPKMADIQGAELMLRRGFKVAVVRKTFPGVDISRLKQEKRI